MDEWQSNADKDVITYTVSTCELEYSLSVVISLCVVREEGVEWVRVGEGVCVCAQLHYCCCLLRDETR